MGILYISGQYIFIGDKKMKNIVKPCVFDYNTSKRIIEDLIKEYPFLNAEICGRSGLGRGIFSLSLGNERNSVIYVGGVHGCEWLTCLVLLLFCERLCYSLKSGQLLCSVDIRKALTELGITIIPCLNPDGTEISLHGVRGAKNMGSFVSSFSDKDRILWKANAMGVDINHNFNASWSLSRLMEEEKGISAPCPRFFGGEYPESEAETRTLTRLCRVRKFRQCLALHSQGEEIYWQYGENTPVQSSMMAKILSSSCNYILKNNEGISSHAGFKDWFISEFSRPGFTMEIGKGENPLPMNELYSVYAKIEEALTVFALM